jgi:holo-[acyl-carrier protein] synthase
MQIIGIGTDIIEIERIKEAVLASDRFTLRVFTMEELAYCNNKRSCYPHLAARFAAKEAVAKAFGRSFSWQEVEIAKEGQCPQVKLTGKAAEAARGCRVMVSISHSKFYATATAMVVKDDL